MFLSRPVYGTFLVVIVASLMAVVSQQQLTMATLEPTTDHYLLQDACNNVLNEQISWEMYASLVYMNMAGYFDRPSVARPGFSQFFRDQSLEEYHHASKFIDYINKRNGTLKRLSVEESPKSDWSSPREALSDAIKLEKHVYAKIHHIHNVAEQKCQDGHLTDFIEGYFFTEQVDSIKELQDMLTTLSVDEPAAAAMIEYLEDVKLRKKSDKSDL